MHPMFEEINRAQPGAIRPDRFRAWQRILTTDIQAQLEERERLLVENAELRAQVERLTAKKSKGAA